MCLQGFSPLRPPRARAAPWGRRLLGKPNLITVSPRKLERGYPKWPGWLVPEEDGDIVGEKAGSLIRIASRAAVVLDRCSRPL